ncbi:TPA: hypothetical protein SIF59_004269 [Escherichia coli]|nr:hypothetical protein [Escherichia coli]
MVNKARPAPDPLWTCSECRAKFHTVESLASHLNMVHLFDNAMRSKPTKLIPIPDLTKEPFRDQLILALVKNLATPESVGLAFSNGKVGDMATKIVGLADLILEKRSVPR